MHMSARVFDGTAFPPLGDFHGQGNLQPRDRQARGLPTLRLRSAAASEW
jgi:hypothetical protein